MTRELTCICCPLGCPLTVEITDEGIKVSGNTCPRGAQYGEKEVTNPTRVVTSSVHIDGGNYAMLSVKTRTDIPKGKYFDVMKEILRTRVQAPYKIGDVVIKNVAGTGVDVVATRNVEKV